MTRSMVHRFRALGFASAVLLGSVLTSGCQPEEKPNSNEDKGSNKPAIKKTNFVYAENPEFHQPVSIKSDDKPIAIDHPRYGYSTPCLADINGDGNKDLLVGQFVEGKIQIFYGDEAGKFSSVESRSKGFSSGQYLQVDGVDVVLPEVW